MRQKDGRVAKNASLNKLSNYIKKTLEKENAFSFSSVLFNKFQLVLCPSNCVSSVVFALNIKNTLGGTAVPTRVPSAHWATNGHIQRVSVQCSDKKLQQYLSGMASCQLAGKLPATLTRKQPLQYHVEDQRFEDSPRILTYRDVTLRLNSYPVTPHYIHYLLALFT